MSKTFKVAAIVAVTALILASPAFSQVRELESNTFRATAGLFGTDVDDSMSVTDYSNVEFDKWFGFAGYGGTVPLSIGFATELGPLYLGTWYSGNIISTTKRRTDSNWTTYSQLTQDWTAKQFETYLGDRTISSNNQLQVLIGVAGMGIKVGFAEQFTHQEYRADTFWTNDGPDGSQRFSSNNSGGELISFVDYNGYLFPEITWGMGLDLGGITLAPRVSVGFNINLDQEEFIYRPSFYVSPSGERLYDGGYDEAKNYTGISQDVLYPTFGVGVKVGLGILDIDVGYKMSFGVFDNKYDAAGFSGNTAGYITSISASENVTKSMDSTTTYNTATINFEDKTYWNHDIDLGVYKYADVFESLELGFGVGFGLGINTESSESYTRQYTKTVYESLSNPSSNYTSTSESFTHDQTFTNMGGWYRLDNAPWTSTTITFKPGVAFGARYTFASRIQLSAGLNVTPVTITNTTTTRTSISVVGTSSSETKNADGVVTDKEETVTLATAGTEAKAQNVVEVTNQLSGLGVEFGGGLTFNFNDRMALDLGLNSGNQSGNFNLNLANVNVLMSVKF